jgi:3-(3-hydroxy-phenyl)propionate hydroxylase
VASQGWLATKAGAPQLSDDVLGPGFACIGLGFDPESRLDAATRAAFQRLGGRFVQLGARSGVAPSRANAFEVPSDALLASAAEAGWVVVVRPDRTVLHDGPAKRAARIVRDAIAILDRWSPLPVRKEQRDAFAQH